MKRLMKKILKGRVLFGDYLWRSIILMDNSLRILLPDSKIAPFYQCQPVVFALSIKVLSYGDGDRVKILLCFRILFFYYPERVFAELVKIFLKMWGEILNV